MVSLLSQGGLFFFTASFLALVHTAGPSVYGATLTHGDVVQAEAMELELRYTLESFEGQLSAMAREKVALQKQVKELTGQCGTVRKQVCYLWYRKIGCSTFCRGARGRN